jgi:hypothetical protein
MVSSLDCHTVDPGSIPGRTSIKFVNFFILIEDRLLDKSLRLHQVI